MTKEQWIVYMYGIWPNGNWLVFWLASLFLTCLIFIILAIGHSDASNEGKKSTYWTQLGKYKLILPTTFVFLSFLSSLIPNKQTFLYIIATPYLVDSGKTIIETLQDPNSKASKINLLLDKSLDKAILVLDNLDKKDKNESR